MTSNRTWVFKTGYSEEEFAAFSGEELLGLLSNLGVSVEQIIPEAVIRSVIDSGDLIGKLYKNPSIMRIDAPEAFSCSSFISYLFTLAGFWQPSISVDKYVFGAPITRDELSYGDLVFSNTGEIVATGIYYESVEWKPGTKVPEGVDHLGMYIGDGKLIHASRSNSGVSIEDMDTAKNFGSKIVGYRRLANMTAPRYVVSIPDSFAPYQHRDKFRSLIADLAKLQDLSLTKYDVPYFSQLTDIGGDFWPVRACGATALAMAMSYFGAYTGGKSGLVEFCNVNREKGAYIYPLGWFRNKLAQVARDAGLSAFVRTGIDARALAQEIRSGSLALLSIEKSILGRKRAHIVLAVGVLTDGAGEPISFLIHDPESTSEVFGAFQFVQTKDLLAGWTLAATFVKK